MNTGNRKSLTLSIKDKAFALGFDLCGTARAVKLPEYESRFSEWCRSGMNHKMGYLQRNIPARFDPSALLTGAESVVVTGLNYFTDKVQDEKDVPVISRYALGKDYHHVVTGKLNELLAFIKTLLPGVEGKAFCDSSPVAEKQWAVKAGLGWQGKNSLVINEKTGSFFFIGILFLNIQLEYDNPSGEDKCGDCAKCIERCPVNAINDNRTIDARKCIASLTIESGQPLTSETAKSLGRRIFGCDICQEVCPWNTHLKPHNHAELMISDELRTMTRGEWLSLDKTRFRKIFGHTPVVRAGHERFRKNIETILQISG